MLLNEELGSSEEIQRAIQKMRTGTIATARRKEIWNDDESQMLTELFQEGRGISEIAILLQRSERAVVKRMEYLGLYGKVNRKCGNSPKGCLCPNCSYKNHCTKQINERADGRPAPDGKVQHA